MSSPPLPFSWFFRESFKKLCHFSCLSFFLFVFLIKWNCSSLQSFFLFKPFWRELQQLWCDSNIQWPLFGSFFSHQGESPVMSRTAAPAPKLSTQLASRVQWLSWLLLYFSGYFLASLWSLFHCQPACELSGTDILTNKMTLWKTDPTYWHISKTDGDLGKEKRGKKLLWEDWHGSAIYKMLLRSLVPK